MAAKEYIHVMIIPTNREREAALDALSRPLRILKRAASKHSLLSIIESDGTELLPVAD